MNASKPLELRKSRHPFLEVLNHFFPRRAEPRVARDVRRFVQTGDPFAVDHEPVGVVLLHLVVRAPQCDDPVVQVHTGVPGDRHEFENLVGLSVDKCPGDAVVAHLLEQTLPVVQAGHLPRWNPGPVLETGFHRTAATVERYRSGCQAESRQASGAEEVTSRHPLARQIPRASVSIVTHVVPPV